MIPWKLLESIPDKNGIVIFGAKEDPDGHFVSREKALEYMQIKDEEVKAAKERVLNEIQDHNDGRLKGLEILFNTPSEERVELAQDRYLKEAYFELTLVGHLMLYIVSRGRHNEATI